MLKIIKQLLERSAYLIAIIATIILTYLSLSSLSELNVQIDVSDKILHGVAYLGLTILWLFAVKKSHGSSKVKAIVGLILVIFGIIIEVLQSTMPLNRHGDFLDVIANSLGVLLALVSFNALMRVYKLI